MLTTAARSVTRPLVSQTRCLSSLPALHTPLASTADEVFVDASAPVVQSTTLANGVRVVSVDCHGNSSTVSVGTSTGSMYDQKPGTSHLLQILGLKSTEKQSAFRLTRRSEQIGANMTSQICRDVSVIGGDAPRMAVPCLLGRAIEASVSPAFHAWEVESAKTQAVQESKLASEDNGTAIVELAHQAAFRGTSLATPLHVSQDAYAAITPEDLREAHSSRLSPSSMVVSGVNVDHEAFVSQTAELVGALPALNLPSVEAAYVGGDIRVGSEGPHTTVGVFFEGASWTCSEIFAVSVLTTLMGGGSSFSAGGPGKGMQSRLSQNVLNRYSNVIEANNFSMFFQNTGLFGLYGTTFNQDAHVLVEVLVQELRLMASVTDAELERAKNQLKTSILTNLEQNAILCDDALRQTLFAPSYFSGDALVSSVDKVTSAQVQGVVQKMLNSQATFAAKGMVSNLPTYDNIASFLRK